MNNIERDYESPLSGESMKDMLKYNPDFKESEIENLSDEEIREKFKEYYAARLPVDLLTWMRVYEPKNKMLWKGAFWKQTMFIRDNLCTLFYKTFEEYEDNPVQVISMHISKSIVLPVYHIDLKKYNTQITIRNNFYDFKVSVKSKYAIKGIRDIIHETTPIEPVYCEGFNKEYIYGMYKNNQKEFTVELSNDFYTAYIFFYELKKSLDKSLRKERQKKERKR